MADTSLLWEGDETNLYTKHVDNQLDKKMPPYIPKAFEFLATKPDKEKPFILMDYGTADGNNFIKLLPIFLDLIQKHCGENQEVLVMLEDLSGNDWKSVWSNIANLGATQGLHFAAVSKSFFKQCTASNTVHMANHILSRSDVIMKDTTIPSMTQEPKAKQLFAEISEKDWEDFLLSRAQELVPGGVLLCLNLADDNNRAPTTWEQYYFIPVDKAWEELYKSGVITKEEREAGVTIQYMRTKEQHMKPFQDPNSAVSRSGLEVVLLEEMYTSNLWKHKDRFAGKVDDHNREKIEDIITDAYAYVLKLLFFRNLSPTLEKNRSNNEIKEISQQFCCNVKAALKADGTMLDFPDNVFCNIMIIRKRQ